MTRPASEGPARRLTLSVEDAAEAMSVSRDSFERHVMPGLRLVRVGRRLLVPAGEIDRWVESHSSIPLVAELSGRPGSRTKGERHRAQ